MLQAEGIQLLIYTCIFTSHTLMNTSMTTYAVHVFTHTHTCINTHICMHTDAPAHICPYRHTCTCVYTCTQTHAFQDACMCSQTCMHTDSCTHTHCASVDSLSIRILRSSKSWCTSPFLTHPCSGESLAASFDLSSCES